MPSEIDVLADKLISIFGVGETEQNWEKIEGLLKSFTEIVGKSSSDEVVTATKKSKEVFIGAVNESPMLLVLMIIDIFREDSVAFHWIRFSSKNCHQARPSLWGTSGALSSSVI